MLRHFAEAPRDHELWEVGEAGECGHSAHICWWLRFGAIATLPPMLTELYIEALSADEALADQVWALWDAGVITDDVAAIAWWLIWARVFSTDHAKF